MNALGYLSAATGVVICLATGVASAQEKTFTFEEIDKDKTLAEISKTGKDPCPIVFVNGKPYRACPNFKFEELDNAIARFEAK